MSFDEWKKVKLGNIAEIIMGQSPQGDTCNEIGNGIPLLNGPTEFTGHSPIAVQYTIDPKKTSEVGDLLFCVRGSTTGKMNWSDKKYAIGRGLAAFRHNDGNKYQPFLRGLIEFHLNGILSHATGSTFPNVSSQQLLNLNVVIPDIKIQSKIATILSSLDSKIELNRQTNQTLETIAQTLFKEICLPKGDELPEGWREETFENVFDADRGLSYNGAGLAESDALPMHNLNSVFEGGGYKTHGIKYYSGDYKEKHIVNAGELIIANTEQGHKYMLIGYPAIIPSFYGEKGIFSHHIYRLRPKKDCYLTADFIYHLLLQPQIREQVVGFANGTTVNMLKIEGLRKPKFVIPPKEIAGQFIAIAKENRLQIEHNIQENQTLMSIRDGLLPKLMKGEIIIPTS